MQQVTGKLLFYGSTVDTIMITTLSAITLEQYVPTKETTKKVKHLLDYCVSQEDTVITYKRSNIQGL